MNLDELGDNAKKENILSIIILMSKVDGVIHDKEMVYVIKLGLSLGLSEEQIRAISTVKDPKLFVPSSEIERMTILYYLVFLIKIDDDISKEEQDMMFHFGLKLGFNHLLVSNIIRVVKANLGKKLPHDAIIKEVRKYLN